MLAKLDYMDMILVQIAHGSADYSMKDIIRDPKFQCWCVDHGYLTLIERIKPHLVRHHDISQVAAEYGSIHVMQWLKDAGCPMDESAYKYAALGGHVPILQWLKDAGVPFPEGHFFSDSDTAPCVWAAQEGHLPALQWLRQNNFEWDERVSSEAIAFGHVDVFQWLVDNDCPAYITDLIHIFVRDGNLSMLQWLHSREHELWTHEDEGVCDICETAVENGHIHLLQWAMSEGCPCRTDRDGQLCVTAAQSGHAEILCWLVVNAYPFNVDACLSSPGPLISEVVAYLESLRAH
jgi:hypothetical protein